MKYDEYHIVRRRDPHDLLEGVNLLIGAGWQPVGGLTVSNEPEGIWYMQAIVKKRGNLLTRIKRAL